MQGRRDVAVLVVGLLVVASSSAVASTPQVPCYFVFGDSLVDNGNNNVIVSLARANYPPYGIDFSGGPTGRFSNGLTTVDVISKLLGFEDFIPPFAGASSEQLLTGVNFASAAAGIREETGQQLGGRISFSGQVENYQSVVVRALVTMLGSEAAAAAHLSKCIFTVGMGSNDYLNNYFMPAFYSTGSRYTPAQYADVLAAQYSRLLQVLYSYGARKVALMGVGQVGCSPNELAQASADGVACVARIDAAIRLFNQRLVALVDQFNSGQALPGAHFTYVNVYGIFQDILSGAPGRTGSRSPTPAAAASAGTTDRSRACPSRCPAPTDTSTSSGTHSTPPRQQTSSSARGSTPPDCPPTSTPSTYARSQGHTSACQEEIVSRAACSANGPGFCCQKERIPKDFTPLFQEITDVDSNIVQELHR